jgi:hypothetical protein
VSIKTIIAVIAVAGLVAAGWHFRDSQMLAGAASSAQSFVKDAMPDNGKKAAKAEADKKAAANADRTKGANPLRKCVAEGRIVYTDEKCPGGTREAPISEGNVTVMPSPPVAAKGKGDEKAKQ